MIDLQIGDSRKLIRGLTDKSIDCVMTSPPYWGLRDYGTEPIIFDGAVECNHIWGEDIVKKQSGGTNGGISLTQDTSIHIHNTSNFCSLCGAWLGQLGLEPTPELYLSHLLDFFDDVKLKLKDEGNCFVNLGDSYSGSKVGNTNGVYADRLDEKKAYATTMSFKKGKGNLPVKCLCMIPQRFAWGMIEHGWILRNEIIWAKPNHMPESVTDRLTKSHEVIYHFVKQGKYYYNLDAIREPLSSSSIERITQKTVFDQMGGLKQDELRGIPENGNASRCNKMVQSLAKKYQGKLEGHENPESIGFPRARTQRKPYAVQERTKDFVEYRTGLPGLDDLRFFLNKHRVLKDLTMDKVEQMFGNMAAHHWFGGECYPSPDDWIKLKEILGFDGEYDNVMTQTSIKTANKIDNPNGKNPGDVWNITTQPYPESHFAVFPLELIRRPILAGCPIGGIVLDPFGGSGTVGEFCRNNERNAILFELNPEYSKLINERAMITTPELSIWCSTKMDA